jgi:rRNA-processing protein FCF1
MLTQAAQQPVMYVNVSPPCAGRHQRGAAILLKSAQRWCRALDHPADDCLYLALAEMRSAVLLTQDQRLLKKSQTLPDVKGLAMAIDALVISA